MGLGLTPPAWKVIDPGSRPRVFRLLLEQEALDTSGMPNDQFSAERPKGSSSTVKIQPAELGDSGMYLCARSSATAWHSHLLPVHKLHTLSSCSS
ncbi:hypothetical protein HPG69_016428 [Diceros bicornis minor]|uniref:Immunoglobulin V-set domain-containing protein n=1 Tax=Diceros bicornis minor TaxID=77932 RepID=A0A7J7EFK8_DICBM|nr:hypothetical protein HPG69_016428 [Diceros bicornis minor]